MTEADEKDLLSGKKTEWPSYKLHSKTSNYAQFPKTEGLGHSLLQHKPPSVKISQGLQIIFVRGDHWIVTSSLQSIP